MSFTAIQTKVVNFSVHQIVTRLEGSDLGMERDLDCMLDMPNTKSVHLVRSRCKC